jgi:hyperosmotically inducible periplasmic protein
MSRAAHIGRLLMVLWVTSLAWSGCAGSIRPANAGAATDNATITAGVKTLLLNDTQVDATKIDVSTDSGVVTISGTVRSKAEEARAIELARQVTGVKDVRSTLQVSGGATTLRF